MPQTFVGGLDLKFFPDSELEILEAIAIAERGRVIGRNTLRLLMMGWPKTWTQFLSWSLFKTIFMYRDPLLLKDLRYAFQQGFQSLFEQLQKTTLNTEQMEQFQLYLSNCLSLLPYADITTYESIKLPQFVNNKWLLVEYFVTPIELTPTKGLRSWFLQQRDRVFAYGLEPITEKDARSHLIFMGTTFPAGQGFAAQVNSDLKGFETVGNSLYKTGRDNILHWLSQQQHKIHVCGVSLGGSLGLLLAIDQGQRLERVDALNPAGLYENGWRTQHDHWHQLNAKPQVVIQEQGNDPVSRFGVWKAEWHILKVKPPITRQGPNAFCDHFLNYAGFPETQFTYASAEQENRERTSRNFWLYSVGRSFFYYTVFAPFFYIARPLAYHSYKQWKIIAVAGMAFIGVGVIIALALLGLIPGLLVLTALSIITSAACYTVYKLSTHALPPKQIHDPFFPRNTDMDIYNPQKLLLIELTQEELHTYYRIKRCLIQQKDYFPGHNKPSCAVSGVSKKELLTNAVHCDKHSMVELQTTKAKAVFIRHVLSLFKQMHAADEELKKSVMTEYAHYKNGKIC